MKRRHIISQEYAPAGPAGTTYQSAGTYMILQKLRSGMVRPERA